LFTGAFCLAYLHFHLRRIKRRMKAIFGAGKG